MSSIAIIPARGGSKGIPNKNLRQVGGTSLIQRAVETALACKLIDKVYVSTDSEEVATVAATSGASVIRRPRHLSQDTSTSEEAIQHCLEEIVWEGVVVFIQCTSPFISVEKIEEAIAVVQEGAADSVFSAIEENGHLWAMQNSLVSPIGHSIEKRLPRQQEITRLRETGAFYVFKAPAFMESLSRFHGIISAVQTDRFFASDIDEECDLELANRISPLWPNRLSFQDVAAVVTDFDGVHTDDSVWVHEDGSESVRVSRSDGLGLSMLQKKGIKALILSTETNPVVSARSKKLGIDCIAGSSDKKTDLARWCQTQGIDPSQVLFLANDVNDLGAMGLVGWPVVVADARAELFQHARFALSSKGGEKAVRELADRILRDRDRDRDLTPADGSL